VDQQIIDQRDAFLHQLYALVQNCGRHPGSQLKGMPLQSSFSLQDHAPHFLTQGNQFSKIIDSLAVSFSPLTVWTL